MIRLATSVPREVRPLPLGDEDREARRTYEHSNAVARAMYTLFPLTFNRLGETTRCHGCDRLTNAKHGWCRKCWEERT